MSQCCRTAAGLWRHSISRSSDETRTKQGVRSLKTANGAIIEDYSVDLLKYWLLSPYSTCPVYWIGSAFIGHL